MRIIAGEFKGRTLKAPKGEGTRPTTDRVRESVMSAINSARGGFDGAVVLDAFAGSGALGFEALSRGAASVCLCERAGEALRVLNANVQTLGLETRRARVVRVDVLKNPPLRARPPFDLVFLDPPYATDAADVCNMVAALRDAGALAPAAIVVYEHAAASNTAADDAAAACGLALASRRKYGDTVVDILESQEGTGL